MWFHIKWKYYFPFFIKRACHWNQGGNVLSFSLISPNLTDRGPTQYFTHRVWVALSWEIRRPERGPNHSLSSKAEFSDTCSFCLCLLYRVVVSSKDYVLHAEV
jgi:hypothetical protein